MNKSLVIISKEDNVATAIRDIARGEELVIRDFGKNLYVKEDIPFGHKISLEDIPQGGQVMKYGETIGRATLNIPRGSHVHVHNIESLRGRGDLEGKNI